MQSAPPPSESTVTATATELFASRVAQTLFRSDSCHRCVLRFSGVRDVSLYMLADDVLCRAAAAASQCGGTPAAAAAVRSEVICPLCLGMLQQTLSPTSLEEVAADVCKVRSYLHTPPPPPPPIPASTATPSPLNRHATTSPQAGYAMRSFALSVSVPPALLVRQRGAWLHLRQQQQQQQASTAQEGGAAAAGAAAGGDATDGGATDFSLVDFNSVVDVKDPLRC